MTYEKQHADKEDFKTLLDSLSETPRRLARLTDGLLAAELRFKNSEDEFSALENFCHLRDLEVEGYTPRINRMLDEDDPVLPDFDGARVAVEGNYNSQLPDIALQVFHRARNENVERLRSLNASQLERTGTLEGVGKITLRLLAEMMREHDEGHLYPVEMLRQQIERLRSE